MSSSSSWKLLPLLLRDRPASSGGRPVFPVSRACLAPRAPKRGHRHRDSATPARCDHSLDGPDQAIVITSESEGMHHLHLTAPARNLRPTQAAHSCLAGNARLTRGLLGAQAAV